MERPGLFLLACAACLTAAGVEAAIPVGVVQTFATAPAASDWSTMTNGGINSTYVDVAGLEAGIQTNVASAIRFQLVQIAADSTQGAARYISNGTLQRIVTRPANIGYHTVLATVQNTTGGNLSSAAISYDLGNITPIPIAEDPGLAGLRVYYSLTGATGSWVLIPGLTTGTVGGLVANVSLGSWPPNALLYVMFIDDNGVPAGDGSYTIDNFLVATAIACPTITQQPANTTNVQSRTVSLSVAATGPGLTYQWSKVGGGTLVDGPTGSGSVISGATTATLVISNAQPADTGDYFVVISNPCSGGPVTSAVAHLQVNTDTQAPQFVSARVVGSDLNTIVVTVDEVLCSDPACGYDGGTYAFVWTVVNANNAADDLGVASAVISADGRNVTLTTQTSRTPGQLYRIGVLNSGPGFQVSDPTGNAMPETASVVTSPTASFQQGDANGYAGTHDTEVRQNTPDDATLGTLDFFNVDTFDNVIGGGTAGPVDGLIRFDNIFGSSPTQIPFGSTILRVTLSLSSSHANANGNPVNMHRMLASWSESTVTWNTMVNGVDPDGIEAAVTPDVAGFDTALTVPFVITLDSDVYPAMLATVQAWADGAANNGWVLLPTGGDGYRVDSSEAANVANRPLLTVVYWAIIEHCPPVIVTQPPASTTVYEGATVTISAGISVCGTVTNQWKKGGVDVPGQTNETLRIVNVSPCDAGSYTLRVSNENGFVETSAAVLVVPEDIRQPVLTRAVSAGSTTIVLTFNKQMAATAAAISNYTLSGGATVSAAALSNGANNATVTLTTSARSATATLTITGVTDNHLACTNLINPHLIEPNPTVVQITVVNIAAGAEWNSSWGYNTNNLDGAPTWKDAGFAPGPDWLTGNALFGTEPDVPVIPAPILIATPIPPDFVTVYFRKSVTLPALVGGANYVLEHFIDDGAVFYWDGVEFGRFNMTNGPVIHSTKAAAAIEASAQSIALPASANAGGTHLLAVELHQGGATTSSDLLFGAQIVAVSGPPPSLSINHSGITNVVTWTADSYWRLVRSAAVIGPYTTVAGNPFLIFRLPLAVITNNAFFELQFNPNP